MKEKFKLTALEKGWILYDVGNSAFILMVSTLIPIFFNALAESAGVVLRRCGVQYAASKGNGATV